MLDSDLDYVAALYSEMYAEQKSFGMVMDLRDSEIRSLLEVQLKSKLHCLMVLDCQDEVGGFISASFIKLQKKYQLENQGFIGYINDLYIKPALRRKNLAEKMLSAMEENLRNLGISYVELQVLENNSSGRKFWTKMGYGDVIRVMYKRI